MYKLYLSRKYPPMTNDEKAAHLELMALINGPEPMGTGLCTLQEVLERVIHYRTSVVSILDKLKS
jgi:hypothetical protein